MSFGGGYNGGRTRMGTRVYLNVYDLAPANDYLYPIGLGLHHSGVEILGSEYSFASGAGVFDATPKEAPGARFRESIELGIFDGGQSEFKVILSEVKEDFGPDDYNLIRKNCNSFANALVWRLLGRQIPAHVNRLADIGVCCSCLLPRKLLEQAPVGDPGAQSSGSSSGFQAFPGSRAGSSAKATTASAFSGTGNRLGAPSTSSEKTFASRMLGGGRSESPRVDELTDRREKARKAALARLERQEAEKK